jgi:hypothetical protein
MEKFNIVTIWDEPEPEEKSGDVEKTTDEPFMYL